MASKPPVRASTRTKTPTNTAVPPPSTRVTRARTATKSASPPAPKKAPARKAAAPAAAVPKPSSFDVKSVTRSVVTPPASRNTPEIEREPIMAYLRIRPHLGDAPSTSVPYLDPISDTCVRMTDPNEATSNRMRYRVSSVAPPSTFTFSHVFPEATRQDAFFTKTTLPLVKDVLHGQSGLLFTYGVTNSGKTYTVQGGTEEGSAGILPRTLDVIFNSIEGLQGDGRYRPVRLQGVELAESSDSDVSGILGDTPLEEIDTDPTTLTLDRNYEYTVWMSYSEVYNEKVYDLLESVQDDSGVPVTLPRSHSSYTTLAAPLLLTRKALAVRPSPACDSPDAESNTSSKYIAGLRQFRVQSAAEAKSLVKLGQLHRRVFGTLANSQSSRSHGLVTVKIIRGHRGEREDPGSLQISRLTLVDLAGSERTKQTQTTGDRLKEAGSINKSLMVLGQTLEVLRSNAKRVAQSLAGTGRSDTRDVKRGLAVVPFRHSKLTEVLMDYFVADGRVVMIVNVNPFDTGYDENSHVMKFAALAREVYTTTAPAPVHRVATIPKSAKFPTIAPQSGLPVRRPGVKTLKDSDITPLPYRRKVTISTAGPGGRPSEALVEVLEVEEENLEDEDEEEFDPFVDALFDEVEDLRLQVYDLRMQAALVEEETRQEVMEEMQEKMREMEDMYERRLMEEINQGEALANAKIDLLHRNGMFASPVKKYSRREASDRLEELEVEMSLILEERPNEDSDQETEDGDFSGGSDGTRSPSPLASKGKVKAKLAPGRHSGSKKGRGNELAETTEPYSDKDSDEGIVPMKKVGGRKSRPAPPAGASSEDQKPTVAVIKKPVAAARMSKVERDLANLNIGGGFDDDSIVVLPTRKSRGGEEGFDVPVAETVKKKKRQLGKTVLTPEDIERAAGRGTYVPT